MHLEGRIGLAWIRLIIGRDENIEFWKEKVFSDDGLQ